MLLNILNVVCKYKYCLNIMPKRPRKIHTRIKVKQKIDTPNKKCKLSSSSSQPNLNLHIKNMNSNMKIDILNSPVKSANDKKEYKVIRLENGLVACLISDVSNLEILKNNISNIDGAGDCESDNESNKSSEFETEESETEESETEESETESVNEKDESDNEGITRNRNEDDEEKLAAASLSIGVGSFSDPDAIPGMAHFLEHMVFMGSDKYPQENDFDAFLKKRGGSDNASTDCETTTFYFECQEKHLAKALDKFAQFFISPLMKRETMTREREAIDSEFQMAIPSDSFRKEQLLATFANLRTPPNKFLWGNLITLRDNVTDDVLYEAVHEFRKRHYSAHRMTLAIQARLPLDMLETYVVNCFATVPSNQLPAEDFQIHADNIFNNSTFRNMYYVKPIKDVCQVDLTFALPPLLNKYKSKPHQYVSWLLGHEGKGSLLSYLREKLWTLAIYTGNGESGIEHNSMYALFSVTLILTPDGLDHLHEVIEAVFSYIALLREVGPQERIFNEIKAIEDTSFRFQEEQTAVDFVEDLSEAMHYYPPEHYITGSELYTEYDPQAISMVINKLNPNNMNILVLSSNLSEGIIYDKTEEWFGTLYAKKEIPIEWIEKWSKIEPMKCFSLPEDNKFLTTNFDLLNLADNEIPVYPEKIVSADLVELWYKPDNKFKLPNAFIYYYFLNSLSQETVFNACMLDLFVSILNIQVVEDLYPATVAELYYEISTQDYGLVLKINGYNQKLPILLNVLIKYIKNVPNATTKELFAAIKDKQTKFYYNAFLKPSKLAKAVRLSILMNTYWPAVEKHRAISQITHKQFVEFSAAFLKKLHIQGLIQGNISKEIALKTNSDLISILQCDPLPMEQLSKIRVMQIPIGKQCCKIMSFNTDDTNSIITHYYQAGPGALKTLVLIELLMLIMEEPLFDVLRTKEQLGYHVYCTICDTYGILGYLITVNAQVKKTTTDFVDERIDEFLKHLVKTIKKLPEKKINEIKEDLIKMKKLVDVHLKDEVSRNWSEIVRQDFMFDRLVREIDAIQQVKISDIRKWLDTFSLDEKNARKLAIQIVGHKSKEDEDNNEIEASPRVKRSTLEEDYQMKYINHTKTENSNNYKFITDTGTYKKELYLFPEHKIL